MLIPISIRCRSLAGSLIVRLILALVTTFTTATSQAEEQIYENRLTPIANPDPLLTDYPEFVEPLRSFQRFSAPSLIDEPDADLEVRAWRFSYNARGVVEVPMRLRAAQVAVIVVHPWGIDDGQGWNSPEPAGVALFCTKQRNRIYQQHVAKVVNPWLKSMRLRVGVVGYSLPFQSDPIRRQIYRSVNHTVTVQSRQQGRKQLHAALQKFRYVGEPLIAEIPLNTNAPLTTEYFRKFGHTDASARYNGVGFWDLPIPVVKQIDVGLQDIVFYDADGYEVLKSFLKQQGIKHILLAGYATDMCVCATTAGYENLRQDFNVLLVGDATLATFPASDTPRFATQTAIANASRDLFITQVSWINIIPQQ